jgi:hypothetical protein
MKLSLVPNEKNDVLILVAMLLGDRSVTSQCGTIEAAQGLHELRSHPLRTSFRPTGFSNSRRFLGVVDLSCSFGNGAQRSRRFPVSIPEAIGLATMRRSLHN